MFLHVIREVHRGDYKMWLSFNDGTEKETGFWIALQQFRQQTDLNEFSEDVFVDVRDKSIGREAMK